MSDRIAEIRARHRRGMKGLTQTHHDRAALLAEGERLTADAAALREVLIDARDKVEWIGYSPEGQQEMNRMRDDCLCRIDAVLARAALGGGR